MSPTSRPGADRLAAPADAPDYRSALRRWPFVLLGAALAGGVALAVSSLLLPDVYRSSSTVIINQAQVTPQAGTVATEPFTNDQSLSETFEQLALQPAISGQVARDLGIKASALEGATTVHAVPRTPLVIISIEGSTPAEASRRTQAYTAQFVQSTVNNAVLPGRAMVVSGATVPTEPFAPRPRLNALVAGVAALLLGLTVLLGRAFVAGGRPTSGDRGQVAWRVGGREWPTRQEGGPAEPRTQGLPLTTTGYEKRNGS